MSDKRCHSINLPAPGQAPAETLSPFPGAGGFDAEPAEGAYFVEGSYTFTAAQSASGPRLAGYKLVDVDPETGAVSNVRFVESTTFVYDAATAAPKMKLIWSDCRPFVMVIR